MQDEFSFINRIKPARYVQSSLIRGIGDDAALFLGDAAFEEIVCMDTMVEGVHFTLGTMSPYDVGYKALAVNISDVAAMGGFPMFYLVSVAVPDCWYDDLEGIYGGMADLAKVYDMDLIGGDTVSANQGFVITVTVIGQVERDRHLLRSSSCPGDLVFVTGPLGNSAAGLALLLKYGREHDFSTEQQALVEAHQHPDPQVKAGRVLSALSAKIALNDISDGISSEANEIAEASGVRLVLNYDQLPKSKSLREFPQNLQREWVLSGGEDFQLIGTIPSDYLPDLKARLPVIVIGAVEEGDPQVLIREKDRLRIVEKKGYNHFGR